VSALFSVIIPTYNRGWLLVDALESVFAQGVAGVQVIVVDDGSTDDTASRVAAYGDRVEYVRQENRGSASARNAGLRRAAGRFITFLDSDDIWLPGKLRTELDLFEAWPDAGMILSDSEHWLEGKLFLRSRFEIVGLRSTGLQPVHILPHSPPLWLAHSLVSTCCMTIRRNVLGSLGPDPFDESLGANEDWDLEIRLYHLCRALVNHAVLAKVRRFADGTRKHRALPGVDPTPEQQRAALMRRRRIVEKAIRQPELFPGEGERGRALIGEFDAKLARLARAVPA
jgi:glycosyltransferase involved in cell wall biosynthesis